MSSARHHGTRYRNGVRERRAGSRSRRADAQALDRALLAIRETMPARIEGRMSEADMRAHVERIEGTRIRTPADCDLVVGHLRGHQAKKRLLQIGIASAARGDPRDDTSALDIDVIASATARLTSIGLHFFSLPTSCVSWSRARPGKLSRRHCHLDAFAKRLRNWGIGGKLRRLIGNRCWRLQAGGEFLC